MTTSTSPHIYTQPVVRPVPQPTLAATHDPRIW
jgi:hypothetical protein